MPNNIPPLPSAEERHRLIREHRDDRYGDANFNHRAIAHCWQGILENYFGRALPEIPPHLVMLMMAAQKLCRCALVNDAVHVDSYDDAVIYTQLAFEAHKEEKKNDVPNPNV